jgi:hypothetical protein
MTKIFAVVVLLLVETLQPGCAFCRPDIRLTDQARFEAFRDKILQIDGASGDTFFDTILFYEENGEEELVRQSPFSISEEGDTWVVTGRQREATDENASRPSREGPFEMKISKFNGQIYDCHYIMHIARRFTPPS